MTEAICGASEEVLGFRTHAQPGWMTGRSLEKSKRAESNQGQNQSYQVGKTKDNTKEEVYSQRQRS